MKKFFLIGICCISKTFICAQINCSNWLNTPSKPSYVDIGKLNVTGNQITVEAVINRTQPYIYGTGDGTEGDVVSKHDNPIDVNYLLRPNHGYITTTNGFFGTPDIPDIELHKTYHIAMVYDGKILKFYRNGCLMSQLAASGNLYQNSWNARIGYYQNLVWNTNFIGYINEVKIWNVARTQAEIQAYMNASLPNPTTQPGLLAYYTFDNLLNKQGNSAYNGTLGGSASINQTNPECKAIVNSCLPPVSVSNIINEYTEVLDLDICKNDLTVADASKYNPGDTVLIIQMKGAVIDSSNTANFGTITDYKNAGNYEFNIIKEKNGNRLSLLNVLERQYDIPEGKVQLIRVPYFNSVNITSTLTCLPWDGTKGGVLVLNVANSLNLNANIDVSAKGFKGGLTISNPKYNCNTTGYYFSANDGLNAAMKGESIFNTTTLLSGRGKLANGGGGGNATNSGGAGGGNGGSGGLGGNQYSGCGNLVNGGISGSNLPYSNSVNKIFLGGGGGAGQENDLPALAPGGNGGGIAIINCASLNSNGFSIISNGQTPAHLTGSNDDGRSGGGSGGTVLLNYTNAIGNITASLKGGNGDYCTYPLYIHGPGGGGGGGVLWVNQPAVGPNFTLNLNGGLNGTNTSFANDPWGATPGKVGVSLTNLLMPVAKIPFKQNIDSVRINQSVSNCTSFDFKGLAYVQSKAISSWSWDFGDGTTANGQNVNHVFSKSGQYLVKLIAADINGCKDSILKTVSTSIINVTKSPDTSLCGSYQVKLFATGGSTYSWFPITGLDNPTSSNPGATPLVSTKYYVTVTNADGCSKLDSVNISVNSLPVVVKSNDTTVCKNSPVPLFAGGGLSYIWSPASTLDDSSSSNPIATPTMPTTYVVNVTNADGCSKIDSIKVNIKPVPIITKSNDTSLCNNSSVKIFATGGSSYSWSPASTLDNPASATPVATPLSTTIYRVSITDTQLCVYHDSVKVSVKDPAIFSISPNNSVCEKNSQQLIASGGNSYLWHPASFLDNANISNPVATPESSIVYSVTIRDSVCNESATLFTELAVLSLPKVKATKSNDITCALPSSHLTASGAQSYSWAPAESLNNAGIGNPIATPVVNTLYTVFGKDNNGCSNSDSVTVKVGFNINTLYSLPNSFTPNNDGVNDCFEIKYWGQIDELDFSIYNRFGEIVFHTKNSAICWDGTYKGQPQDAGIFVYIIKAKAACGNINKKGTVMLLR